MGCGWECCLWRVMRGNWWPRSGDWSTCPALGWMSCDLSEDLTMSASSPTPNTCQLWSTTTSPPNLSFPTSHHRTLCKVHSYLLIGAGQFLVFTWSVKDATILEWAKQHSNSPPRQSDPGKDERLGPLGLTLCGTGTLAHGLGLEVVIVSSTTTIDEAGASIICLIIPPTMEKSHAGASFFGHTAYVCREMPELRF